MEIVCDETPFVEFPGIISINEILFANDGLILATEGAGQ